MEEGGRRKGGGVKGKGGPATHVCGQPNAVVGAVAERAEEGVGEEVARG